MGPIVALGGVVVFLVFAIWAVSKVFGNYSPKKGKIKKDLQKIKTELEPLVTDLVPIEKGEMELLSLNQIKNKASKGVTKTGKGVFTSIYNEPMVAYSYKNYVASGTNALIYARTANNEFIYRIKNNEVEIVIDDHLAGIMKEDGKFYGAKSQTLLAEVNQSTEELALPVIVRNKNVGSIINPAKARKSQARAFEYVGNLEKDEETLFLSLAVLELVQRSA